MDIIPNVTASNHHQDPASQTMDAELELESNVRHQLQRQIYLMQLCEQECEAAVSRTNASIAQAISLLQDRGAQLVSATRSCYSQAKLFHSDLHSRTAALFAQLHVQPKKSQTLSDTTADAAERFLKILDDARASPLCVGCGGLGVSVDLSDVTKAISDLQVRVFLAPESYFVSMSNALSGGYQRIQSSDAGVGQSGISVPQCCRDFLEVCSRIIFSWRQSHLCYLRY
jgi:hypothetical protein